MTVEGETDKYIKIYKYLCSLGRESDPEGEVCDAL